MTGAGAVERTGTERTGIREMLSRRSLRTRITLLVATAVGVTVALVSLAAYFTIRYQITHNLDSNLEQRAEAAAGSQLPDTLTSAQYKGIIPSEFVALGADVRLALIQPGRGPVVTIQDREAPYGRPEYAVAAGAADRSLRTTTTDGTRYRVVAVPVPRIPGAALVLAQATTETDRQLSQVAIVMLAVGIAGIAVAAASGLAIARAGLRPVERLTAAAEHIARTEDLRPIPVTGDDELARLTVSVNAMLAALEESRERQRQLVADAGHELRTPLTSLRTNLDLLAQATAPGSRGLDPADHEALLADVRAQLHELTVLVSDLVELARTDPSPAASEPVDVSEVLARALERVRRRAPALSFAVSTDPWIVEGDPAGLERAITNLLDNAAKWSPDGGTVSVSFSAGTLRVADQGPGIAPADQPHVFDRFYRATDARSLPGSGLGLAIVRQVAERHGGWVQAAGAPGGGALLILWLPGAPPV